MMPVEEPEQDWAKEQDMGTILRSISSEIWVNWPGQGPGVDLGLAGAAFSITELGACRVDRVGVGVP